MSFNTIVKQYLKAKKEIGKDRKRIINKEKMKETRKDKNEIRKEIKQWMNVLKKNGEK